MTIEFIALLSMCAVCGAMVFIVPSRYREGVLYLLLGIGLVTLAELGRMLLQMVTNIGNNYAYFISSMVILFGLYGLASRLNWFDKAESPPCIEHTPLEMSSYPRGQR
ncbi:MULTISPECIES: hypothetical protein [unclassified Acinetobacter]|uniref:hypothetical protein n=1 Tax=unclassified Acinetobacter TaxID=196816 RepID=UPI0035B99749